MREKKGRKNAWDPIYGERDWHFYEKKEGLLPENMNRNILVELLKEHDMRCMNTYFEKPSKKKATYVQTHVGNRDARTLGHRQI